jgi:glycosyltransferase involved in cell wall biosynthesis
MLHLSDEIVVLNEYVKNTTLPRYSSKVNVINPGTTLPISKRIQKKMNQHNKIIFVGNLDRANAFKGLETLLRAFAQTLNEKSTISLEVVGGGDHLAHYYTVCEELGITDKVIFVGAVDPQQIASHYENADLLVLPSLTNAESLGLVLLEAMSFGLPVVASNVGGIPYVVEDRINGRLVPPGNIRALSESILYTLNDLNYSKFSANNLQTSKRFNWVNHTESLTRIFQKAVEAKGGR